MSSDNEMPTTVKIYDADKAFLDRLQAVIFQRIGKKLPYAELLHYLLIHSDENVMNAIIDDICNQDIDWASHLDIIGEYGDTDASHIDEVVYEGNDCDISRYGML